jgi:uncharacterized protein
MHRFALENLGEWLASKSRKPLIIRGARQVGKSTIVRMLAETYKLDLLEINLEKYVYLNDVFKSLNPTKILREIEDATGLALTDKTILFLDEIQAVPAAIASLRYFFEEKPSLPVIAAGSLLELILPHSEISMPVGRIDYFHLGPCSFREFLLAGNLAELDLKLSQFRLGDSLTKGLHQRSLNAFENYCDVGGMPEATKCFTTEPDNTLAWRQSKRRITDTYQDDFSKYRNRGDWVSILQKIYRTLPNQIGQKVKYSELSKGDRNEKIHLAVDMLANARIITRAKNVSPPKHPLSNHASEKVYKPYWLDIGLIELEPSQAAEQFVAQHLAYSSNPFQRPELYYWLREGKSDNAEVDFIISTGTGKQTEIVPIEVKSGATGKMKSLLLYIERYSPRLAVRLHPDMPRIEKIDKTSLISLPIYLAPYLHNILSEYSLMARNRSI